MDSFNTDELVLEMQNVIKNGLKKILKNHINRYELLEETHKQIMSLPSIANELNKNNNKNFTDTKMINYNIISVSDDEDDEDDEDDKCSKKIENITNIENITKKLIKEEMGSIEEKLEIMEKKYESITPLLETILSTIKSLNNDIILLKQNKDIEPIAIVAPSIVSFSVNENIKLEIEEKEEESDDEDEKSDDEDDDEDEESEDEEEVEEESEEEESEEEEEVEEILQVVKEEVVEVKDDDIETEASEEEEEEEEEEDEEELFEIEIDDTSYCTNNEDNGFIYELTTDGDVGEKVGYLKEGEPFFYADEK